MKRALLILAVALSVALGGCKYDSESDSDDPETVVACNCAPGREPVVDAGVCACVEPAHDCAVRRPGSFELYPLFTLAALALLLARRRVRLRSPR